MDSKDQFLLGPLQDYVYEGSGATQQNSVLPTDPALITQIKQPLSQQVYPVVPPAPAQMTLDQNFGHLAGQHAFEAPQTVAPEQPAKKLGRPRKPKIESVGPKNGPGRPAGAVDSEPRLGRGEMQNMTPQERKVHRAGMRVKRKLRNAARAVEAAQNDMGALVQPPVSASIVPQAPNWILDSGYNSESLPSTASSERPSEDSFTINYGVDVDHNFDVSFNSGPEFDVGQQFASVPGEWNTGSSFQPSFDPGYYPLPQSTLR